MTDALKIYSWNVNSVRSRIEHLLAWLQQKHPDVVLLQEIKIQTEAFPAEPFEDLGYNVAVYGQKTYNGVAILSKSPLEDIKRGFPGHDETHPQARYLEAVTSGVRVASVYVPNGQEVGSEKFLYKLDFLRDLDAYMETLMALNESTVIGGDYNIAPRDQDTYDPLKFQERILVSPPERQAYWRLLNQAWSDAVDVLSQVQDCPAESLYTWWDYRQGSWEQNKGLRIDHFLVSPQAADRLIGFEIDRDQRALPRPSDHAPLGIFIK